MEQELNEKEYHDYMGKIKEYLKKTEFLICERDKFKTVSNLSFEDWVKWRKGELKLI